MPGVRWAEELASLLPEADAVDRARLDLTDLSAYGTVRWGDYDTIVNAAAYTAVDDAETPAGRRAAWETNVAVVGRLVKHARRHRAQIVHLSSDYVFDGTEEVHSESEPFSPLGVYGQTKAAGDAVVSTYDRHYILRTSWVIGEGKNFVRTMVELADRGVAPAVIDDQIGRLTFAQDIAGAIRHLLESQAPYGTYNVTSCGKPMSWADIAQRVFEVRGREASDVTRVSTDEYTADRPTAPRPRHSLLDLRKIEATGFEPADGEQRLASYLRGL